MNRQPAQGKQRGLKVAALALTLVAMAVVLVATVAPKEHRAGTIFSHLEDFRQYRMQQAEKHEPVTLVVVGDIMLSRYVAQKIEEHGDPGYPLAGVRQILQQGDIVFGNLESPITPGRTIGVPEMVFRADPPVAAALQTAGFNLLSLANNHSWDFGAQGLQDTMHHLDQNNIGYVGAGPNQSQTLAPRYLEVKGTKLAFVAFCDPDLLPEHNPATGTGPGPDPGVAPLVTELVTSTVREAAAQSDFTVFYLHAGREYDPLPDQTQSHFARLAIAAGADLVLGSHPHVIQKLEQYRGKYILHSPGNFIFDQLWSRETREGVITSITISSGEVEQIEFVPFYINDETRPVLCDSTQGRQVLARLAPDGEYSRHLQTIPVWDTEKNVFTTSEQLVYRAEHSPAARLYQTAVFDLDGDGRPEHLVLRDGRLTITNPTGGAGATGPIWSSPAHWWVDYFFLGDIDNDGRPNLNLSVWKEGSFHRHRPFWHDPAQQDTDVKNHLFIFRLEAGGLKPVWMSSSLDRPHLRAAVVDLNEDGKNELQVTEGSYTNPASRETTLWQWNGWGFFAIP